MKRHDWKRLALLGFSSGILVSSPLYAAQTTSQTKTETDSAAEDPNDGNMNYHLMTEDELLLQLNPKGIAMYKSLDSEGKALALIVASAYCMGTNPCKGLNACSQEGHDCAGKGECKGQGKCATGDKNLAVKMVRDRMAAKRSGATR
ncbi:MAG: hypothetical protein H0X51_00990 [Parachlamydiaceae bacterium]|nr:hypothetical protein [Parachlamydiaceae bacterium]